MSVRPSLRRSIGLAGSRAYARPLGLPVIACRWIMARSVSRSSRVDGSWAPLDHERSAYTATAMIERRPFGRTGHMSSVTLFGAAALARATQDDADRALEVLLRYGVNHIDTAARYGDSELRIAPWMARHRQDFFLATKTGSRDAKGAREDLHRSLERLRVDHVDLIQ